MNIQTLMNVPVFQNELGNLLESLIYCDLNFLDKGKVYSVYLEVKKIKVGSLCNLVQKSNKYVTTCLTLNSLRPDIQELLYQLFKDGVTNSKRLKLLADPAIEADDLYEFSNNKFNISKFSALVKTDVVNDHNKQAKVFWRLFSKYSTPADGKNLRLNREDLIKIKPEPKKDKLLECVKKLGRLKKIRINNMTDEDLKKLGKSIDQVHREMYWELFDKVSNTSDSALRMLPRFLVNERFLESLGIK